MAERAKLILEADSSQLRVAEKQLDKVSEAGKKTEKQAKRVSKSFSLAKNSAQQLGFQIQDTAVQLQGGQSLLLVLTQQGSQLASVLGPGGAVIGGFLAVSGAIAGYFLPSLLKATDGTQDYIDRIKSLTDNFKDVTEAQKIFIEQQKAIERQAIEKKIADIRKEIELLERGIDFDRELIPQLLNSDEVAIFKEAIKESSKELVRLNADLSTEQQELKKLADFLDIVSGKRDQEKERIKAQKDEVESLSRSITRQAREEIALLNEQEAARVRAVDTIDRYSLSVLTGSERIIETYNRQKEAVREAIADNVSLQQEGAQLIIDIEKRKQSEIGRLRDQEIERQKANQAAQLNQISGLFAQVSSLASSENRKAFELGKAASIANATIKGVQSAVNAYEYGTRIGGPIAGASFAAISAAFTGAQIAQIESQKPPRAQGGQMLPNKQYRVGEFGPEIISVGGSGGFVTQPQSDGASPVNITVNTINNAANTEVAADVRQVNDREFVIDIIAEQMTDSRSRGRRGLQSTSNVQARA